MIVYKLVTTVEEIQISNPLPKPSYNTQEASLWVTSIVRTKICIPTSMDSQIMDINNTKMLKILTHSFKTL